MTLTEYANLKDQIEISVGKSERHGYLLNVLKELFKNVINSDRRFEIINSIADLLYILETRDALSKNNVTALKDIAKELPNKTDLLNKIQEYEDGQTRNELVTEIGHKQSAPPPFTEYIQRSNNLPGNLSSSKSNRIYKTLTEEIGIFWRDLARNLNIKEKIIDDIDKSNYSINEKAKRVIENYNNIADPDRWFYSLCDALDEARRKDLSQSLRNIMAMNI